MKIFNEELGAALKVGDLVAIGEPAYGISDHYGFNSIPARIRWVEPITAIGKLHVTIAGQKWNRKTGYRWGAKPLRWSALVRVQIVGVMTPEEANAWRERDNVAKLEKRERAELLKVLEELVSLREKSPVWSWPMENVRTLAENLHLLTRYSASPKRL